MIGGVKMGNAAAAEGGEFNGVGSHRAQATR